MTILYLLSTTKSNTLEFHDTSLFTVTALLGINQFFAMYNTPSNGMEISGHAKTRRGCLEVDAHESWAASFSTPTRYTLASQTKFVWKDPFESFNTDTCNSDEADWSVVLYYAFSILVSVKLILRRQELENRSCAWGMDLVFSMQCNGRFGIIECTMLSRSHFCLRDVASFISFFPPGSFYTIFAAWHLCHHPSLLVVFVCYHL